MSYIIWPEDSCDTPASLGGKGASLWSLLRDGFPVPPAFCLPADAHRQWLQSGQPDDLPEPLREELLIALHRLSALIGGADSFAVRSSALAEDSADASFAGQLQTHLNVPASHVPSAVLSVWRSADAPGVVTYRQRIGLDHGGIAVVVQAMVPAEVSGVVFTADPLTGDPDRLAVNASWGLGEGIVSGLVTPDYWIIDRRSGRVLERQIGEKAQMVVLATTGSTEIVATPPDKAARPCLTPSQLSELLELAQQAEAHFGRTQDLEWAYRGGRFWLLQSRPLTVQPSEEWISEFDSETDPDTVWTAANIQEVLPGAIPPFTWSTLREGLNYSFRKPFLETHTLRDPNREFVALFYNRAYLNVSALRDVADRAIGTSPEAVDEQYLGKARDPHRKRAWPSLRQVAAYIDTTPRSIQFLYRMRKRVPVVAAQIRRWLEEARSRDLASLTKEQLLKCILESRGYSLRMGSLHISTSSATSVYFESLRQLLKNWFGREADDLQARLITGLNNVASAIPGRQMWALAKLAAHDSKLREALMAPDAWARIQKLKSPSAAQFRDRLAQFLGRFGHRSVMEADLSALTWGEDPNSVLVLLRNFLDLPPEAEPLRVAAHQRAQRLATTREIEKRLGPLRRPIFRFILRQTQIFVSYREKIKSLMMEVTHHGRRLFREVGHRLWQEGIITDPQDLYLLTLDEVVQLLETGPQGLDIAALVRRRRAEFARNQRVRLPESFRGRPKPLVHAPPPTFSRVLRGIPVSPGIVTGPARVIRDPRKDAEIRPGEILVAPVTDAGWTPLFLVAAGLVVDIGGPLSHGSTVAREYGLPAVVNVKVATQLVHTGQTITVNGSTGEVFVQ